MGNNYSFGTKLLISILGATIFIFGLTMFFVTKYSYDSAQEDAKMYASELAGKYSSQIQGSINQAMAVARTMSSKFELAAKHNLKLDPNEVLDYYKTILQHNENLLGVWWTFKDPSLTFDVNLDNNDKNAYDKNGYFNPYVTRSNNGFSYQIGSPYDEKNEWINGPKRTGKPFITKPYLFEVSGKNTLMTSICIPMYKEGEYIGAAGVDFKLDTFSKMASDIKIYETGYTFIIDHYDMIIGHPNKEFLSKKLANITNNDKEYIKMLKESKKGKDEFFFKRALNTGLDSLYYSKAFKIENVDAYWSFVITVPKQEYLSNAIFLRNFSFIASIFGLLIIAVVIIMSVKVLNKNLKSITKGLDGFFRYLNKESNDTHKIQIDKNDEFGIMAKSINKNVAKIKQSLDQDIALIDNVKDVANIVAQGKFNQRIDNSTTTESLNELKDLLNEMLDNLESQVGKDINIIINALDKYTNRDFTARLDDNSTGKIGKEIIRMNKMITRMLQDNQRDGLSLQQSSDKLTSNVQTLSQNATNQATSLEESAASIDEITSNIEQTSKKAQEMNAISEQTKKSANQGKLLANDTVKSMDDINNTVININEAIAVIDQIAFQTNILSLNAAVEAATAGEAGKGFAVVAGEVRNLAARSAEAAKDIKELVENATTKANKGKEISASMIQGFTNLEEKVVETSKLINDVTTAAKEQSTGMKQIADAVGLLDKFTQENASIADQTNGIAKETLEISEIVVTNVTKNNFDGKDLNQKVIKKETKVTSKIEATNNSTQNKTLSSNNSKQMILQEKDDEQWESF